MSTRNLHRPAGITVLAIVNGAACFLTVLFWALVYFRLFAPSPGMDPVMRASAAATLGFLVGDIVWAVPLLALGASGLWKMRQWGYLSAQMVNILWLYSLTVIWVRDLYAAKISPGAAVFTPFALIAACAVFYLWKSRKLFLDHA